MANYIAKGRQVVIPLTNKAANAVEYGDVVILDTTATDAFDVTTTENYSGSWIGVVVDQDGIAVDAVGRICVGGYVAQVNLDGAAAVGDYLFTDTVAEQGTPNAARGEGAFGQAMEAGAAPSAYIWGNPDGAGGGGDVATDDIWDAAGDLVQGTGANTAAKLTIGTYPQILRVNSGATAAEWVSDGRVFISEQAPVAANTVSFTSIPNTYQHLMIEYMVRSEKATATIDSMYVYLNNDTTSANYRRVRLQCYGTVAGSVGDDTLMDEIPQAASPAGCASYGTVRISYYKQTTFNKQVMVNSCNRRDASTIHEIVAMVGIEWESTSAVNRVDFTITNNFVSGSVFRLYGLF